MNLNPLSWLSGRGTPIRNSHRNWGLTPDSDRFRDYTRYLRAYRGYRSRVPSSSAYTSQQMTNFSLQRVRFNFNKPIVNLSAAFLAAKPLKWDIDQNEAMSKAAADIWDRSGSERALLKAARCSGIYGEVIGLATQDADGRPRIEFKCPDIAMPTFRGSDAQQLTELELAWEEEDRLGRTIQYREFFTESGRQLFIDQKEKPAETQEWDKLPCTWTRNLSIEGLSFGLSDLEDVADLVDEYDHLARKRGQAIDYHAMPNIVFEGVKKTETVVKDGQTVYFLNAQPGGQPAKAYFLEWAGTAPDVESHLTRILDNIGKVSQTPAIAFGEGGFANISGVALAILFQPLLAKCNDKWGNWGPDLEYLMWLCLRAEGKEVPLEAVNVKREPPLPVDTKALSEEEKLNVEAGFHSTKTAMTRLGVEDVEQELKEIEDEQESDLQQVTDGFNNGLLTRNEARARKGLPPVAEADEEE
jgi:hypothetical protein